MEAAVSMVLSRVLSCSTAWADFGDGWVSRLQSEVEARPLAGTGPHSRRNPWKPEAVSLTLIFSQKTKRPSSGAIG